MGESVFVAEEERELEFERKKLDLEREDFKRRQESAQIRMEREKYLFDMKFKLLEEELRKLADEKKQLAIQKEFYYRSAKMNEEIKDVNTDFKQRLIGKVFFQGVRNEAALKKRYKELSKIFHPDNMDGDTLTIQEINREYNQLKKAFCR